MIGRNNCRQGEEIVDAGQGAYRYYIPGFTPSTPSTRIALSPLRRLALTPPDLGDWFGQALSRISKSESVYGEFEELARSLPRIKLSPLTSKTQIARFYKSWFDGLASVPLSGRPFALFQDLSKAFVLGRSLPTLPVAEKTARRPERVAQQLMLNCI